MVLSPNKTVGGTVEISRIKDIKNFIGGKGSGKGKRKGPIITGLIWDQPVSHDTDNTLSPKESLQSYRDQVEALVQELGGFPMEMTILEQALERLQRK